MNWTIIDSVDINIQKICFTNNFGFCTGMNGKIFRSSDNGTTWTLNTTLDALYVTDIKFNNRNGFCITNNQTVV